MHKPVVESPSGKCVEKSSSFYVESWVVVCQHSHKNTHVLHNLPRLSSPLPNPPPNSMRLSRLVDWVFCDAPSNDLPFTNRVKVLLFDFEQGARYRDSVNIQFNAMHSNQSRHTLGIVTLFAERMCSEQHGKKLNHMLRRWFERPFSVRIKLYPKVNKFQSY